MQNQQKSYAKFLNSFNRHTETLAPWFRELELYGLKYLANSPDFRPNSPAGREHSHSFYEMHLVLSGQQSYIFGEEEVRLQAGDFLLIRSNVNHYQNFEKKEFSKYSIMLQLQNLFPFNSIALIEPLAEKGYLCGRTTDEIVAPLHFLFRYSNADGAECLNELNCCIHLFVRALCGYLCSRFRLTPPTNVESEPCDVHRYGGNNRDFCEDVAAYIRTNISRLLTLGEVARHFNISTRQLNRRLQEYYEKSFTTVADKIRCDYARDLLRYTGLSIEEIAERVGYGNASSFVHFFKRVEGQAPLRFRNGFTEADKGKL